MNLGMMIDNVTVRLMENGLAILQADKLLASETVEYVKSLVANRPEHITAGEGVDEKTAMAGVALGLGLAQQNREIENEGGFPAVVERLLGPEAAEILRRGE